MIQENDRFKIPDVLRTEREKIYNELKEELKQAIQKAFVLEHRTVASRIWLQQHTGEDEAIQMFTRDLFYTLCDKYGVELSDQYEKPMLKVDGAIRELVEQDVKDILPQRPRDEILLMQ